MTIEEAQALSDKLQAMVTDLNAGIEAANAAGMQINVKVLRDVAVAPYPRVDLRMFVDLTTLE